MTSPRKALFAVLVIISLLLADHTCLGIEKIAAAQGAEICITVEQSYHGQLGIGTGLGMVEKWCALPMFKFSEEGGIDGWISRKCDDCHIGAAWNPNKPTVNCLACHPSVRQAASGNFTVEAPTVRQCLSCHRKDTEKRGDFFDPNKDVHLGLYSQGSCQSCHISCDHQIAKGTVVDTSEPTKTDPVVSCTMSGCHPATPHSDAAESGKSICEPACLDRHCQKVACESCHTDTRTRSELALASRDWTRFKGGQPISQKHEPGWLPVYKWYDGRGPSPAYHYVPILDFAERKESAGAKIYPFNVISITWLIKSEDSDLDDIIPTAKVRAAARPDPEDPALLITTEADMRTYDDPNDADHLPDYPKATLITRQMNFNLSHSIRPKEEALACSDCHGQGGRKLLDWYKLGYKQGDPWGER